MNDLIITFLSQFTITANFKKHLTNGKFIYAKLVILTTNTQELHETFVNETVNKDQSIAEKRTIWLHMKSQMNSGGTSESKRAVYSWLYKNDRDWLMQNKLTNSRLSQNSRIDWVKRDEEMAIKVKETTQRMKHIKKTRISRSEIARQTGTLSLVSNRLEKLPQTKKELLKVSESTEQFQMRRIELSINELRNRFHVVKGWEVAKMAGLRTDVHKRLKSTIDNYIYFNN